jgi:hypothetical protein
VEQGRGSGEGGIGGDAGGEAKAGGGGASNKATKTCVFTEQQRNVENQANHSTHSDTDTRGANGLNPIPWGGWPAGPSPQVVSQT